MNRKMFEQARGYAEKRLEGELPPSLPYHGIVHTREEVVPAAERIAAAEGMHGSPLYLLLTAAWFHDLGFVEQALYHELIGARLAGQVLPAFGYKKQEVEIVRWAILATALPQAPQNLIDSILADADLATLGSVNFKQRNRDLREEFALSGRLYSDEGWYSSQLRFLEHHRYFTCSARHLFDAQKQSNMEYLKSMLDVQAVGS
ncbi:MAG: phosphohydrolase [Bacteroidota bacterium]